MNTQELAKLHISALPHTWSSRRGRGMVAWLYEMVGRVGYVKTAKREGKVVGAISGVGPLILTLVVAPEWQKRGVGRELLNGMSGRRVVYTEECTVGFYEKMGFRRLGGLGGIIVLWRN